MIKWINFVTSGRVKLTMEKKDILIWSLIVGTLALNLYLRYARKKKAAAGTGAGKIEKKGGLSGSPDDYEPYSKR